MKYIEFINNLIKEQVTKEENVVIYGQNINAGSCLGGLTKDLAVGKNGRIINSTNSENTLCGFGFGLMMNGISSVFFMKQLDFLLLGIDHLVNTFNIIRNTGFKNRSSFTIFPITIDNGYQGPQSSLNNFSDFCSIAKVSGYTITNKIDAENIISSKLISPGFRIISVSQRLFKEEIIEPPELLYTDNNTIFQYSEGSDVTLVCFNFSFPYGWDLYNELQKNGISVSLFNVNSPIPTKWEKIITNTKKTQKLIIIDDSKSENIACDSLIANVASTITLKKKVVIKRILSDDWLNPVSDKMEIDNAQILNELIN